MPEYIIDNDGYTAPELHDEAVALVSKLNPQPLVRCRDCAMCKRSRSTGVYGKCTNLGMAGRYVRPDSFCSWGERKGADRG
ncbi:MAG: hypothetical protein RSB04_13085 [Gordonibacter sp.]|uniref:hypothetical protein n=1 Tax=Gordonibacter sp. TaxID=1968902 RepID=UPI002FC7D82B